MLQTFEPKKYTVITKDSLLKLSNEQQSRKRRKRNIASLDKIDEIRLEYMNILKIDCLWPLTNLVKLRLNNNVIEKIENLDGLKFLCELDLSFNRIKKIENLDALTNLHVLSLYNNEIEIVEGLDSNENLSILSLGKNNINDLEHVLYLRQFKELRSLQISGNPCTERSGYTSYLIAFVPQLVYYGYKMITEKEREIAAEKHRRAIATIIDSEAKKQREKEAVKKAEEKVAQLSVSYVEYLDEDCLFESMFENDDDGKQLAKMNQEAEVSWNNYRQAFSAVCHEIYELGMKEENRRRAEIDSLNDVIENKLTNSTTKARKIMSSVQSKRGEITVRITQCLREAAIKADDADLDDESIDAIDKLAKSLSQEFKVYVSSVWTKLMREETILHEQIEEMCTMFKININDMVTSFLEIAQEHFGRLRAIETEYNANITAVAVHFLSTVGISDRSTFVSSLLEDENGLNNCISGSHRAHLQVIAERENRMIKRLKDWQATFLQNLTDDETERSRSRILEIAHFLNHHRENASVDKILGQQTTFVESLLQEDEDSAAVIEDANEINTISNDNKNS